MHGEVLIRNRVQTFIKPVSFHPKKDKDDLPTYTCPVYVYEWSLVKSNENC